MRVVHVAECIGGVNRYLKSLLKYSTSENILLLSQLYKKEDFGKLADKVQIVHMSHVLSFHTFLPRQSCNCPSHYDNTGSAAAAPSSSSSASQCRRRFPFCPLHKHQDGRLSHENSILYYLTFSDNVWIFCLCIS